jgi:hypothetical protein
VADDLAAPTAEIEDLHPRLDCRDLKSGSQSPGQMLAF